MHSENGVTTAFQLLISGDPELLLITWNSLQFALLSTVIATLLGAPIGLGLALNPFPGKRIVVSIFQTLMGLPTVLVGLLLFGILSRSGPLGFLGLLFTPMAVILGQALLSLPIIISLISSGLESIDRELPETLITFGANKLQQLVTIISEGRIIVISAVLTGFGRVIGEVGAAMMLGGNIRWYTRTITTAIALETQRGAFSHSLALGIILLGVAFAVNGSLNLLLRYNSKVTDR